MSSDLEQQLLLETAFSETLRVDREQRVIRDVKILGRESRNGRVYTDRAMAEAAALYEGCDVNIDHPPLGESAGSRRLADGFGVLRNVRREAEAVFGDLHYFDHHPLAALVLERAERSPDTFGLSHNASGRVAVRDGQAYVEAIDRVLSVDLVRDPATTTGLFEQSRAGEAARAFASSEELQELRQRLQRLENIAAARRLLERRAIDAAILDEARFDELIAQSDAASMQQLVDAWPPAITTPHRRPAIAPAHDPAGQAIPLPRDASSFARAIA